MTQQVSIAVAVAAGTPITLEGVFEAGTRGAAVIAPPHPLYGGRLDNPVVVALADGLHAAGMTTLRFDFRGVGHSSGHANGTAADADADYRAVLEHLAHAHAGPYVAAGYSFGAASAIRVASKDRRIARLVVIAPPVAMLDVHSLRAFHGSVTFVVGDADEFAPLDEVERALASLPHVRVHVIAGADHFFGAGVEQIAALARGGTE